MTRTWVITGAGRGLGRALALAAAEAGDRVLATVRTPGSAPEHRNVVEHVLDVRDRAAARETVRRAVAEFGRLDVVVNNAGYGLVGMAEEVSEDEARDILETNLLGALWLTQAALPVLREQRSGHVVQVSSVGGAGSVPGFGLYSASKWGLEGMSEAIAQEVAEFGVRVSIVEPGGMDTEWATGSMRFAAPDPAYDGLRERTFGTTAVPWAASGTGGGTPPEEIAAEILRHVNDPDDQRLRVLAGADAPAMVATALSGRLADYRQDKRFADAEI
ncbi:SDR family NAD(P)-dependent oxidoreductase [Amycolatopsis sp. WGS_07]|uniref:SDR family NAD(P)-dependent oxidoreductase n=1 Tax=Amycolatopsis sp. WGS_07 TaxID=3076764 RepID=UPI0038731135